MEGRSRARRLWTPALIALTVAAAYALGSGCAWVLFNASDAGAVFFPPAGVTLGALLLVRRRHWPWVLLAAGAVELAVDLRYGLTPAAAAGFALTNMAEPLVGAALFRRFVPGHIDLTHRRDAVAFLTCAVGAGPVAGALIGATTSALSQGAAWWPAFGRFWAGDGLAVLTLGAAVVGLGTLRDGARLRRLARAIAVLGATAALTVVGFWPRDVPLIYLPVPLLLALAFWGRVPTVGAAGFVMAFAANLQSAAGHGPWAGMEPASLQVYLAFVVLGGYVLAIAVAERDRARAQSRREVEARQRLQSLQAVTAGLSTAATPEQVIRVLVDQGVGIVADHGGVALADPSGEHLRMWPTGAVPTTVVGRYAEVRLDTDQSLPVVDVVRTGDPIALSSLSEISVRYPQLIATGSDSTRSLLVVPVRVGQRSSGALAFGFDQDGAINAEVASLAQTLAELAGQAIERAARYEAEHETAHQLQRSLLPEIAPHLPGVTAAVRYRPAERGRDVGGDWYDVFELPGNRVGIAVGDVVGHGLAAAISMGRLQQSLRSAALTGAGPAEVLEALDTASASIAGADFATVGYAEYNPIERILTYSCAGHLPPLLVVDGTARYLDGGRSQPLRLSSRSRPQSQVVAPPGAMLVWYSDGLIERRHQVIDMGLGRLATAASELSGADPQAWCDQLLGAMTQGFTVTDDIVVACLYLDGPTSGTAGSTLRLRLSSPDDLAPTRRTLRVWCARQELSEDETEALLLACNEALSNALEHAYRGLPAGPVALKVVRVDARQVRVEVTDRGRWRANSYHDAERGRGLNLVNKLARRVVVDLSDSGTRVTITLATD